MGRTSTRKFATVCILFTLIKVTQHIQARVFQCNNICSKFNKDSGTELKLEWVVVTGIKLDAMERRKFILL